MVSFIFTLGSWSKITKKINGRNPYARDDEILEYDFDSEAEWEEEEPGEDISSEKDDNEDEEDVANQVCLK